MTSVSLAVRKRWPVRSSSRAQLAIVVDLAVEDADDACRLSLDIGCCAGQIDDAQSAHAERRPHLHNMALVVRGPGDART